MLRAGADHARAFPRRFGPTAVGYLLQGGAKFAGYEFWKKQMVECASACSFSLSHGRAADG